MVGGPWLAVPTGDGATHPAASLVGRRSFPRCDNLAAGTTAGGSLWSLWITSRGGLRLLASRSNSRESSYVS